MSDPSPAAIPAPNPWNTLAWVVGDPVVGEGTWVGPFVLLDGSGGLEIGRGCDISAGAQIYTHSTARRCVSSRAADVERASVRIGDSTFIGANAVVMMGVTIGSHCIVGAGAVVTHNIPDCRVVAGVPARIIGHVDPETGDIDHRL